MKTPKYLKPISGNEQHAKFARAIESFDEKGKANPIHIQEALHIAAAIEYLRSTEADTVTILCDNPEPETLQDQCAIECNGDWTNYEDKRFQGARARLPRHDNQRRAEASSSAIRHEGSQTVVASAD